MGKREIRQDAQERLLSAMQVAFDRLEDETLPADVKAYYREQMSKQMGRVEVMFGYQPGSFARGC